MTNLIEIDLTITVALNYPYLYTKKGLKCLRQPPPFVSLLDFFMWEFRGFRRCLRCSFYLWDRTLFTQVIGWLGSHKQVLFTSK